MTLPPPNAHYLQAAAEFDEAIAAIADRVASVSSQAVRNELDRWKHATHRLLDAHRQQVADDVRQFLADAGHAPDRERER